MGAGRKELEPGFVLSGEPARMQPTQPRGFLGAGPEGAALVKTPSPFSVSKSECVFCQILGP